MNVTRLGLDLAKNVFQIHGVDRDERVVFKRKLHPPSSPRLLREAPALLDRHGSGLSRCHLDQPLNTRLRKRDERDGIRRLVEASLQTT